MPVVNWLLAVATLAAVVVFGSSDALAGAYGIAVSVLMAITTLLAALIALRWGYNPILVLAVNGFFLAIDLVFFAANSVKLFEGGWFPLVLAGVVALPDADVDEGQPARRGGARRPAPAGGRVPRRPPHRDLAVRCLAPRPSCRRRRRASRCTCRASSSAAMPCPSGSC